jgi:hypothetical protein
MAESEGDQSMKEKIRFCGIIAIVAVIVFSMNGCGDFSGEEQETAEVTVINRSGVTLDLRVYEVGNDSMPKTSTTSSPTSNNGEKSMTVKFSAEKSYYVSVYDVEGNESNPSGRHFLCRTNNFSLEKGQTKTFTTNGSSIY